MEQSPVEPLEIRVKPAKQHFGPPESYKNVSEPRGSIFIANFTQFENPKLEDRNESKVNVHQLQQLFTQMHYEVDEGVLNETRENTVASLERFRNLDIHERVDSTIVIVMSYGTDEEFYAFDGKPLTYKQVYAMFGNKICPALKGKPKLFIFHSYNTKHGFGTQDSGAYSTLSMKRNKDVSSTYVSISTGEGHNVDRCFENGTPFFHHACKIFMDNAKDIELETLMKMVGRELTSPEDGPVVHQLGCKSKFHFNPPLEKERKSKPTPADGTEPTDLPLCLSKDAVQTCAPVSESDSIYKMSSSPQGRVLILNNLLGCKKDVDNLSDVFKQLDYDVLPPLSNLPYTAMIERLEEFTQEKHNDSSIVIFYGHGFEDHLVSSDNLAIKHRDITRMFNDSHCRNLTGKPKLFIFNSCVTDDCSYPAAQSQTVEIDLSKTLGNLTVHDRDMCSDCHAEVAEDEVAVPVTVDKDMMIYCAEVEGGDCEAGSLLTDALYQVLLDSRNSKKELTPLLRLVTNRLDELSRDNKNEEYFVVVSSIRFQKDFYFDFHAKSDTVDGSPGTSNGKYFPGYTVEKSNRKSIIIGFTNYESGKFPKCDWHNDEITTIRNYTEKLGYSTDVYLNLTRAEVQSFLQDVNDKEELDRADSLFVIVLGFAHDVNNFYDVKGKKLPVSDIFHSFTDKQCPKLQGKPKIFFFHMTESEEWQSTSMRPTADDDLRNAHLLYLISSMQGNSESHPSEGLKVLYNSIENNAKTSDIDDIFMEAEQELVCQQQGKFDRFIRKRVKTTKDFYFNPNILQV